MTLNFYVQYGHRFVGFWAIELVTSNPRLHVVLPRSVVFCCIGLRESENGIGGCVVIGIGAGCQPCQPWTLYQYFPYVGDLWLGFLLLGLLDDKNVTVGDC